jgi:Ca-activated chloride channel family protein
MRTRLVASLGAVCLLIVIGFAAQDRATLTGTVVDASGNPVPGVAVTVDGPERRSVLTNERGVFAVVGLLPGVYQLQFELAGYRTMTASVRIGAGETSRATYTMRVAALEESVTVAGSPSTRMDRQSDPPGKRATNELAGSANAPPPPAEARAVPSYGHWPAPRRPYPWPGGESYAQIDENPFRQVSAEPLSTFSIDVDTAAYSNVRRFLNEGTLPPADAVRIEEMINYFRYRYSPPRDGAPFSVTTELVECPWNPKHRLALIGLQGQTMASDDLPPRNLVFLIDVSGSMQPSDRLPLIRNAMRMFSDTLNGRDRVAIVVYAGSSGLVLPSTPGDDRGRIHRAIAELEAGGSTNGGQGIQLAYRIARANFVPGGINRVILATDGDFNVGITSHGELVELIERERTSGVFLSVLGVGTGNLKDSTMEMLADKGNGNYAYLDSLQEARKVLIHEAGSTLVTIAKDVKLQVEFNPRHVAGYRLIGYENRLLRNEDFNDDRKDAGEIGAGHSVTALYEIVPAGVDLPQPAVDPLKYQTRATTNSQAASNELLTVKLRYKNPTASESQLIVRTLENRLQPMSANLGFASAVAEVGMLLRGAQHAPTASFAAAISRARKFREHDEDGYRAEFVKLAEVAASLKGLERR